MKPTADCCCGDTVCGGIYIMENGDKIIEEAALAERSSLQAIMGCKVNMTVCKAQ